MPDLQKVFNVPRIQNQQIGCSSKFQGGKRFYFELLVGNKKRRGAKKAITGVFDENLELVRSFTDLIK